MLVLSAPPDGTVVSQVPDLNLASIYIEKRKKIQIHFVLII